MLPLVIGKVAVPDFEMPASPTGLGVSLSVVSAFTKLGSSATAVWRPVSWSIFATGLGCDWLVAPVCSSPPPQAAAPTERAVTASATAGVRPFIGFPSSESVLLDARKARMRMCRPPDVARRSAPGSARVEREAHAGAEPARLEPDAAAVCLHDR